MTISEDGSKTAKFTDFERRKEQEQENDILNALQTTGHQTCVYSNGLIAGIRLEGIPGTRGVHVDIVHVLDLRVAKFGRSNLAMRAAVLESINRGLKGILEDIGIQDQLDDRSLLTPWGRIQMIFLRDTSGQKCSMIHETRTVYVITEGARPVLDLSWLTDNTRVIDVSELGLLRNSDVRSLLPELKRSVGSEKWTYLEDGLKRGWFGVLSSLLIVVGLVATIWVLLFDEGNLLLPLIATVTSSLLSAFLLIASRQHIGKFQTMIQEEHEILQGIGDGSRILQSIRANEEKLKLLGDLNFVVSPLMAAAGSYLQSQNIDGAVLSTCSVLDECVRLAPSGSRSTKNTLMSGDEGLSKFLGLFETLGSEKAGEDLALAYVGLTGHVSNPISYNEVVQHTGTLNNHLFDSGALRPDIKDSLDDILNERALEEAAIELGRSLEEDEAVSSTNPAGNEMQDVASSNLDETRIDSQNTDILEMIKDADIGATNASETSETQIPQTGAEIVDSREHQRPVPFFDTKSDEIAQTMLLKEKNTPSSKDGAT
ncbi:MAG: hypothetical protein ACXABF_01435 [Candidatus Thorarchaeota archaeon]